MRRQYSRAQRPSAVLAQERDALLSLSASIDPASTGEAPSRYEAAGKLDQLHGEHGRNFTGPLFPAAARRSLDELARTILWLDACFRRSCDRHRLSQLDRHMRADLRQDRVQAELAKRSWQL
jgi:hypothetical protein